MKKSLKLTFILLVIICISLSTRVFAASIDCNMEIQTSKAEYSKGEEFVANVYISDIKSETGIIALQAVLDYDKSNLTLLGMAGKSGWDTPAINSTYNPDNGKIVLTRNALGKDDESVFEIRFKVNDDSASSTSINLKNIKVVNGDDTPKSIVLIKKDLTIQNAADNNGDSDTDTSKDDEPTTDTSNNNNSGNSSTSNNSNKSTGNSSTNNNNTEANSNETNSNEVNSNEIVSNEVDSNAITNDTNSIATSTKPTTDLPKDNADLNEDGFTLTQLIIIIVVVGIVIFLIIYFYSRYVNKNSARKHTKPKSKSRHY